MIVSAVKEEMLSIFYAATLVLVLPYRSIQYILKFLILIIAEFLSYKTPIYICRQEYNRHENVWNHSLQFGLAFVHKNLKFVSIYLFVIMSFGQMFSILHIYCIPYQNTK